MKVINADKLVEKLSSNLDNPEEFPVISLGTVMRMIDAEEEIHTSQPEIIRCGECAHFNKEYSGEMWCGICNGFGIDENSFCSFAEKRYVENG